MLRTHDMTSGDDDPNGPAEATSIENMRNVAASSRRRRLLRDRRRGRKLPWPVLILMFQGGYLLILVAVAIVHAACSAWLPEGMTRAVTLTLFISLSSWLLAHLWRIARSNKN